MADTVVESLVAREIEKAYREGWRAGYSAGYSDGGCDFDYCDPEKDWRESEARKRTQPPSGDGHGK